jgi:hypothetical protein
VVAVADVVERASEFSVEKELKALVHRDLGHWLDVVLLGSGDSVVHLEGCRKAVYRNEIETVELGEGEGPWRDWSC